WGHGGSRLSEDGGSVGWSGSDDDLAREALLATHDAGINHWDTADAYGDGHAERLIGEVLADVPRHSVFLATKVGWVRGGYDHFYHPRQIEKQMAASLRNLRTETIDLYYLHHCDFGPDDEYFDDAIALLRRFRDEGKIRFIGLSDWDATKIVRFIERADPDVVQPFRNVIDDTYQSSGLRSYVDARDLGVAFFSPLKHGLLLGKYDNPIRFPEGDFRSGVPQFEDPEFIHRMKDASAALRARFHAWPEPVLHGVVGALLNDAPTGCVLLGQRNPRQVQAASEVGEALSDSDAAWVRTVYHPGQ
ncbi:MAG: aldo/keto reductase, partial [Acidobacteriota bacterium]